MTLDPRLPYPSARSYVLKLHRDALPEHGKLSGRLENMTSGRHYDFNSGEQLLTCLLADLMLNRADTSVRNTNRDR
ncbi:MAG: hypothetical protein HY273_06600 [Gammaproteobacteria bacterium]|nr:hypothetical protein [Gammaproteobacteria bacterium]